MTKEESSQKSCCAPKDKKTDKHKKTCNKKGGCDKDCDNCTGCGEGGTGCGEGGCKHTKGKDKSKKSCCASKEDDEDSYDVEERDFSQFPDPDDTDYDSSDYIELNDDSVDETYSDSGDSVDMTR